MKSRLMLLLIVAISTINVLLDNRTTTAQELTRNVSRENPGWNSSPKNQQIPVLFMEVGDDENSQRGSNDLRNIADSIKIDNRQTTEKRSPEPLEFFKPPSLPSSVKVPVKKF